MVHFTCDLCGKDLSASGEPRYVVKIATYAGFDPNEITDEDLDEDHMEAVAEAPPTRRVDPARSSRTPRPTRASASTSAPSCHGRFVKDPLGKELLRTFDFSKN